MSRLEELIEELCPDGVRYEALENIIEIKRGTRVVRSQLSEIGDYPVFQNSLTPLGFFDHKNADENTTFIIVAGAAGEIGYSSCAFWAADDCFYFLPSAKLMSRYIYHFLLMKQSYLLSRVRKASVPRLARSAIEKLEIPVPPLEVQGEIVRILDQFTELTTELSTKLDAELTARKKQYAYYRGALLTFDSSTQFERLGDTCNMKAGKAIAARHISPVITNDAPYQCYGGNGVRGYVNIASHHGEFPIIGRQGALCGNVNYANGDFYATEHAVVVESKGQYIQKFLCYLLLSMNLNQYKSQGAQPGLAVGNLENLIAPVPTLEEQHRIVSILDRFDTLCNDLTSGLPAEVEARRKQYEYYRDKLLTFEESESNE